MNDGNIGIGVIGTGFMGRCHAAAYAAAAGLFGLARRPALRVLADIDGARAAALGREFGFVRATADWRELVADPGVEVVAITTPNHLHKEMALAAVAAGKHVHCEKPLAVTAADGRALADAAEAAGVRTLVGYNFVRNPAIGLAKAMIEGGEIGAVVHFRGINAEDYMADPAVPYSWRCRRDLAGLGALADLGSHCVSLAAYLVGEVEAVCGQTRIAIAERPSPDGPRKVENEDHAHALLRFAGGALGTFETSRVAPGRKSHLAFEITGTRGTLLFDQERMNELGYYGPGQPPGREGFTTILSGPRHPPYAAFCPAPGHGLGFNDLKVIEAAELLRAIVEQRPVWPDFRAAWRLERVLHAIVRSAAERRWVDVAAVDS